MAVRRTSTTDGEGRYEFAELPAGRYTITVSKAGYVGLQYGQRRPFEPGTPVILADGQALDALNVSLPRGSVIAGRVTDEFGEPIASAQVQAQRYLYGQDGQRQLQTMNIASSDDLGQFRVFGLMPGEYVVSAVSRGVNLGSSVIDTSEGYLPTYYPGTVNLNDAQVISLAVGQETAIQFSLTSGRMARISGAVADSSGRPVVGAMLMLRSNSGNSIMTMTAGQTAADGSFSLSNVPTGDHVIEVQPLPRPGGDPGSLEFASMPVSVGGSDISGLRIVTGKGAIVTGRVVFEGQSPRTGGVTPLRVMPQAVDPGRLMNVFGATMANGMVADDGSFELAGASGQVFFRVATAPGWTLKSVSLEGEDITDVPFDLTGKETVSGLRIVLTDRLTDVSGQVTDGRGRALKDYAVVLLPAEPMEGTVARFLRVVRPDQDGRFRVRGMPPGRYVATAVESLEQGRQFVPEVQRTLRERGRSFSIAEGASATLALRLTSPP